MSTIRTKTLHYKKAQPNKAGKISLQELLRTALKNRDVVMDRARQVESDSTHLINYSGLHGVAGAGGNLLGVEFLSFSKGQDPSALIIDPKAKELSMEQIPLSADGKEAIEGSVYFGVLENHVILAQSPALRALHLERYLNWLLHETGGLAEDNYIGLVDFVPAKTARAMRDVREVQMSGPVGFETVNGAEFPEPSADTSDKNARSANIGDVKSIAVRPKGGRWQAVRDFFGDSFDFPDTLSEKQIIAEKSLEVTLILSWKQARDSDPSDLLNAVATNLRHVDDEVDYKIISKSGMELTRDEIKQRSKPLSVKWDKGRPVWDDIFPKMLNYLESLGRAGTIKT